jgi:hypothetical protein
MATAPVASQIVASAALAAAGVWAFVLAVRAVRNAGDDGEHPWGPSPASQ